MTLESYSTIEHAHPPSRAPHEFRDATRDLPRSPGIYIMKDFLGHPIYVGKAKDLRRRVASYFAPSSSSDPKVSKLLSVMASLHYAETDSELEALLLESRLVKQWLPMYNRDLRQPESMCFLRMNAGDALPGIDIIRTRQDDGALCAGPFRSMSFVHEAVEAVRGIYRLRQCTDPVAYGMRRRACAYCDFGRCSGPCAARISADEYRSQVLLAWESLTGASSDAMDRLVARRSDLVEQFRFEDAYRVQGQIRALEAISCGRLSAPSELGGRFVVVVPSASAARPVLLLIDHGKLVARFVCDERSQPTDAQLSRTLRCLDRPGRDLLPSKPSSDDLLIVHSYLRRHRIENCIIPYPSAGVLSGIRASVETVGRCAPQPS